MKIGIIGLNINNMELNYGTALHTWAFIEFLDKNNLVNKNDIEIINYFPKHSEGLIRKYPIFHYIKKHDIKKMFKMLAYTREYAKRYEMFHNFICNNFAISKPYTQETLNSASLNYEGIIVESDTVWCKLSGKFDRAFFLNMKSMEGMLKIAYAPDTGVLEPNEKDYSEMRDLMKEIQYISGRGAHATEIISKCTAKKVKNVVDPTLLISSDVYDRLIENIPVSKEKFILLYIVDSDEQMRRAAEEYAHKHNCKILEFTSRITREVLFKFNRKLYMTGVEDFLSKIKYADCIFTNSFHGICLSIIYRKEFYAFQRNGNKIKDLCAIVGLNRRLIENVTYEEDKTINYEEVYAVLDPYIRESKEWLIYALKH